MFDAMVFMHTVNLCATVQHATTYHLLILSVMQSQSCHVTSMFDAIVFMYVVNLCAIVQHAAAIHHLL